MNRTRTLILSAAVAGFLIGFFPQWLIGRSVRQELRETRLELRVSRVEGQMGAALTEASRSNYERSRQLMTQVFAELQILRTQVTPAQQKEMDGILAQRDEIITLLARAAPVSSQRLLLIYARYHAAVATNAAPPAPGG
ncbi:MAG TPA: hypothetical protein VF665_04110 [Longimicrobium sp.]|jgi:hypothetical protein|uniref:hypothetical protein n=1 Tax=Longimicrobium sp. TaxID=2029185 RepID=UPI002EDAB150